MVEKYKGYNIESTPSDQFDEMVTLMKGKKFKKRFVNKTKAILWVDSQTALKLIDKTSSKVKTELSEVVL
jgi:hypothetical protein